VPRFELSLRHEPRHRAEDDRVPALTVLDLALATPSSDAMHMQSLLRERLARLALPAPAIDLRIRCAGLVHEAPPSLDRFATRASVQAGFGSGPMACGSCAPSRTTAPSGPRGSTP
jgi:protein ImuB